MVFLRKPTLFMSMNTGVYKILNLVNGKFYIGSTSALGFKKRWWCHQKDLRASNHHNQHLQNSWNKYGEPQFQFEIVEKCCPSQCLSREQHYIDTLHPAYNILAMAGSPRGYRHAATTKAIIGNASRGPNNYGYTGEHKFYNPSYGIFVGSLVEFWKKFRVTKSISYKLRLGVLDKSHGWIYIGTSDDKMPDDINTFYVARCRNNRPIYQFHHIDGTIFAGTMPEFIAKYHLDRSVISKLVRGKRHYAYGWNIKT